METTVEIRYEQDANKQEAEQPFPESGFTLGDSYLQLIRTHYSMHDGWKIGPLRPDRLMNTRQTMLFPGNISERPLAE